MYKFMTSYQFNTFLIPSVFHNWQHNPIISTGDVELIINLSKPLEVCTLIMQNIPLKSNGNDNYW